MSDQPIGYTCPSCGRTSYHPKDLLCRYCGACGYEDDDSPYRDAAYPERACDHCGKLYRGPAVYCSLRCAVADA